MPFPSTCHAPSRSYVGAPSAISWLPSEQMRQKKKKGDRELFWALSVLRAQYPTSLSVLCPGEMCNNKAYSSNTYNLVEQLPEGFYITAENAYCFSFTLFIPFSGRGKQDISKDAFIFFLSQLRIQIEQVFGLLVTKWQVFKKPIEFALWQTLLLIEIAFHLHNFFIHQCERKVINVAGQDPSNFAPNYTEYLDPLDEGGNRCHTAHQAV
jgi:hypothetical protein